MRASSCRTSEPASRSSPPRSRARAAASTSDDDGSIGFYGHGGLLLRVGSSFYLGLDARALTGTELEIFGIETDADYVQLAAVFAWGG